MRRTLSCLLVADLAGPCRLELQVAVVDPDDEQVVVTLDGSPQTVGELATEVGGRLHHLTAGPGRLEVSYRAVTARDPGLVAADPRDPVAYLRPSRYCESDRLGGFAEGEFAQAGAAAALVEAVVTWVRERLRYLPGSSRGTDSAVDTLLAGEGVCRDFAHLTVALLRAREVPSRVVSCYAPGLVPMDFHAVVEALVDDRWELHDPTGLTRPEELVRIATGRDAADTAFLAHYGADVALTWIEVRATAEAG